MREHRFAPLSEVLALLTEGWSVVPLPLPHGAYSVLATRSVEPEGEAK